MSNVDKIKKPDEKILNQITTASENKFNRDTDGFPGPKFFLYFKKNIFKKFALNPHATLYVVRENSTIVGFAFLIFLEWDSNIFGFKIGRIENLSFLNVTSPRQNLLKSIIQDCIEDQYIHINCRIGLRDYENLHLLEKLEFNVMDIQTTFSTPDRFDVSLPPFEGFAIRRASGKDLEQLKKVVSGIFTDTRFMIDRRFSAEDVNKLYFEWLKNSILDPAQIVFLLERKNNKDLIGFSICVFDPHSEETLGIKIGSIDLIAINKNYRNKGIGQMFIKFILNWFKAKVDKVEIRTQISNLAAIKAFISGGFTEFCSGTMLPSGISLHRWF